MANIRRRTGKRGIRWQVQVRLAGEEQVTKTFETKAAATDWARDMEGDRVGRRIVSGKRTVAGAIERYFTERVPKKAPGSQRSDASILKWWFEKLGDRALSDVTSDDVVMIRGELEATGRSPATVNRYLAGLSAVYTRARKVWRWVRENPVSNVGRLEEPQGRVRYLEREEIARLLAACERGRPGLRLVVAMALYSGMRQGEVLGLRWSDVDLERRVIVLHKTKNKDRRGVPISDALAAEIERHPRVGPLLFPSDSDSTRSTWNSWRRSWRNAVKDAGLQGVHYHDTRHTAASHLAMKGATERQLAELLGHRTMQMVKRYSHLSQDHMRSVVNLLADEISPASRQTSPASEPDDA